MSTANSSRRSLALVSFIFFFSLSMCGIKAADELQILLNFAASFQKSDTDVFSSWKSTNSICNFAGITCNSDGNVKEISLSYRGLSGVLPLDSICQLQSLEKLSFGFNNLYGKVSDSLNNCVRLQYLDLGNNFFTGTFPDISSLSELRFLYLNTSGCSGPFPWISLSNMTNLVSLSLGDNKFDRAPFSVEILKLYKLDWLYLSNCSIEGSVPMGLGNLTELRNLELADNFLSGEIPPDIVKLRKLWQLELYDNNFTGRLPIGFGNLTNLKNFDASDNQLEGNLSELRFLTNLVSLQLFMNQFTGEVPQEFGDFRQLVNLSLYMNKLTGSLPLKLGSWAQMDFIDVSENFLTGPIPPEMCKQGTMKALMMIQNRLTGEIPASYAKCLTLTRFRVSNNSLSGVVPAGIWGLPNADLIDVASNQLEGPIASDIANANSLGKLVAANNRFSGELPSEISKASSLVSIDLSSNQFSGEIPRTIGELKRLGGLHLQNNHFSGPLPNTIGLCDSLSDINISNNSLSGEIPSSLGSLPTLNSLNLANNKISGRIPATLSSLRLSLLDLSNNKLSGHIPESLNIEAYNGSFDGNPSLCSPSVRSFRRCLLDSGKSKQYRALIGCLAAGLLILLASLAFFVISKRNQKNHEHSLKEDSWDVKSFQVLSFTEDDILDSIKQENLIGKGGSGNVYKVMLANGKELAVKHVWNTEPGGRGLSRSSSPMLMRPTGKSQEFDAEVQTLSSIRHVNVVKLYCSITSEDSSLLVYEYLPNGSLWDRLHTCRKMELDWETRYEIAIGASKGLEYLHHGCEKPVIHRDVKSSNILLDEFLKPRIADFGLAKIVRPNGVKDSTHVIAGTPGYLAPEYGYTYKVNEKSDVYSFGVVLMELVTGKRPIEAELYGENNDIVNWVCSKVKSKESAMSLVDPKIPVAFKEEAMEVLRIAILCTSRLPELRPTMRRVVQMLEEAVPCKLVDVVIGRDGGCKEKEGRSFEKFDQSL